MQQTNGAASQSPVKGSVVNAALVALVFVWLIDDVLRVSQYWLGMFGLVEYLAVVDRDQ